MNTLVSLFRTVLVLLTLYTGPCLASDKYAIDPKHVWISFAIQQGAWAKALGRLKDIKGEIIFDKDNVPESSVMAEIDANSVDTADAGRDQEVKSEFLKAYTFPKITFVSTKSEKISEKEGKVTGDLTIGGMTNPVTLAVVFNASEVSMFNGKITVGFSAIGTLNTDDFKIGGLKSLHIGPEVSFMIEVEAIKE